MTQPLSGFNSSNLAQLFGATTPTSTGNTSTTSPSSPTNTPVTKSNIGAIAGGAAAGGVVLLAIAGVIIFLILRHKRNKQSEHQEPLAYYDYNKSPGSDSPEMNELAVPPIELPQQRGLYERQELGEDSRAGELPGHRWEASNAEAIELEGLSQSSTITTSRTP